MHIPNAKNKKTTSFQDGKEGLDGLALKAPAN